MDYYGGYGDYRHTAAGGTAAYHQYNQQQPPNVARYGPTSNGYRHGMQRSGPMYDGYDRFAQNAGGYGSGGYVSGMDVASTYITKSWDLRQFWSDSN